MGLSAVKRLAALLLSLALCGPAVAYWQSRQQVSISGAVGCTEATNFLARTSGLDAGHTSAYTDLICGLVTDGVWAKLDAYYMLLTQDSTTALLNLVQNNFNAGAGVGTPTFSIDAGYAFASGQNFTTAFNPSIAGGLFVQNSALVFVWSNTSGTNSGPAALVGGSGNTFVYPRQVGTSFYGANDAGSFNTTAVNVDGSGFYAADRSNATTQRGYKNGTQAVSATNNSTALANGGISIGDANGSGGWIGTLFVAGIGSSLSDANHTALYTRTHTFLQTIGGIP